MCEIIVKDRAGNIAKNVSAGVLDIYISVKNDAEVKDIEVVLSMGDVQTKKVSYLQTKKITVPLKNETFVCTIDMEQLDDYSAYTKFLEISVMDCDGTEIEQKIIEAVQIDGIVSDFWISNDTEKAKGLLLIHRHGIGENLKDMNALKSLCQDMDMAIISFIDAEGMFKGFYDYELCGNSILKIVSEHAKNSGHNELNDVPIATFGHSNSTMFASKFADWVPERVFAVIAYKSACAEQIEHFNIAKYNIPMLVMTGETDWGYGYNNQIYAAQNLIEKGGIVQYIQDPSAGHGPNNWMSNSIVFEFLRKAYEYKVSSDAKILKLQFKNGLLGFGEYDIIKSDKTDIGFIYKYIPTGYITYDEYKKRKEIDSAFKVQAWLFDEDYAKKWIEFNNNGIIEIPYNYKDENSANWG